MEIFRNISATQRVKEKRRFETILRMVNRKSSLKILDVGCGHGELSCSMAPFAFSVTGIDLAEKDIKAATEFAQMKDKTNVSFQVCDAMNLGTTFAENSFDIIICSEVLEHILDLKAALEGFIHVLKPGGQLIISVPYNENIQQFVCIHCGRTTPAYGHVNRFDKTFITGHLEEAGIKVKSIKTIVNRLHNFPPFARISSVLPYTIWFIYDQFWNSIVLKAAWMVVDAKLPENFSFTKT
jgi:ubiquinone biosynthesis O-methyltransferase